MRQTKVLFIGPLPPPVDGQSKATAQALIALKNAGLDVSVVNTNRDGLARGFFSQFKRIIQVLGLYIEISKLIRHSEIVYISIAESILGNIKDLIIYLMLYWRIDKVTIHMLGGSGMDKILNETAYLSRVNGWFMSKMAGVIVEGRRGYKVFGRYVDSSKIHVVANFADDYLTVEPSQIIKKFECQDRIQVLYLSNLIKEKGCWDLLEAFLSLPHSVRERYSLKFVGGFPTEEERLLFLKKISTEKDIEYVGTFIDGNDKLRLYLNSHIFCLPTYYPYEGQPISILEAYSTGCAVITTSHGGIPDIFTEGINGFLVEKNNPESISRALTSMIDEFDIVRQMALNNAEESHRKYSTNIYRSKISQVFKSKFC